MKNGGIFTYKVKVIIKGVKLTKYKMNRIGTKFRKINGIPGEQESFSARYPCSHLHLLSVSQVEYGVFASHWIELLQDSPIPRAVYIIQSLNQFER